MTEYPDGINEGILKGVAEKTVQSYGTLQGFHKVSNEWMRPQANMDVHKMAWMENIQHLVKSHSMDTTK